MFLHVADAFVYVLLGGDVGAVPQSAACDGLGAFLADESCFLDAVADA
jgi:hypothetical protein